ncbi:MAG: hypothetical protein WA231_24180 [Methylocella sp.]
MTMAMGSAPFARASYESLCPCRDKLPDAKLATIVAGRRPPDLTRVQDIELMQQYQDFGFQPPPRLEAVAQRADEKEGNCNNATIML